jgi:hypothetical protein
MCQFRTLAPQQTEPLFDYAAEISLGEAAPEQHTNQHKIRHICIIGF